MRPHFPFDHFPWSPSETDRLLIIIIFYLLFLSILIIIIITVIIIIVITLWLLATADNLSI